MSRFASIFLVRGEDGLEYGPVDLQELRQWVQENRAGLGTMVRRDNPDAPWLAWQEYPELVTLLAEKQAGSLIPGLPQAQAAPMWRRALAGLIDFIFAFLWTMPLIELYTLTLSEDRRLVVEKPIPLSFTYTAAQFPPEMYVMVLILSLVIIFYLAGFQAIHGKTPGKALLGLRLVNDAGENPSLHLSLLRALILVFFLVNLFPVFLLGFVYTGFNPQRRGLHDYLTGTYVVK